MPASESPLDKPNKAVSPCAFYRKTDALGAAENIRTEADAEAYVEALVERWGKHPTQDIPGFEFTGNWTGFKDGLAQAEFAAVRDPQKLILEAKVAETFNHFMDEWQMPAWTHASVEELHAMRVNYSYSIYPKSVVRLSDKSVWSVAPGCRPTEALLLLNVLNSDAGVPCECRKELRERHFPWIFLKRLEWPLPPDSAYLWRTGLPGSNVLSWMRYRMCQESYLRAHPEAANFQAVAKKTFSQLGIPVS